MLDPARPCRALAWLFSRLEALPVLWEVEVSFLGLFTRRFLAARTYFSDGKKLGATGKGMLGRTRMSLQCRQSDQAVVRRLVHSWAITQGMAISHTEVCPRGKSDLVAMCFTIEYRPRQRQNLLRFAQEASEHPLIFKPKFGRYDDA